MDKLQSETLSETEWLRYQGEERVEETMDDVLKTARLDGERTGSLEGERTGRLEGERTGRLEILKKLQASGFKMAAIREHLREQGTELD